MTRPLIKVLGGAVGGVLLGAALGAVAVQGSEWAEGNSSLAYGVRLFFRDLGRSINGQLGGIVGAIAGAVAAITARDRQ
jgi:hypothetical protein